MNITHRSVAVELPIAYCLNPIPTLTHHQPITHLMEETSRLMESETLLEWLEYS